ncbi:MAG TPA: hypothetical protein PK198_17860, partial [Saprospiraceae bacterium]|nr:hypothetical protein [Saprospiraceae bacterium]
AMNALVTVAGSFSISGNSSLVSTAGFESLTSVHGVLRVTDNPALQSLTGLDNVNYNYITWLIIANCNMLSICDVQSVCDYLELTSGPVTISNNAIGCANVSQVEA